MLGAALSNRKWAPCLWGFARASLVVAFLVCAALGLGLRNARAAFGERLLGFGTELTRWDAFRFDSPPRQVSVNGVELELVASSTALSVAHALDRLEGACTARGGIEGADQVSKLLLEPRASAGGWLEPRIRRESDSEGIIACLDTGGPMSIQELTSRLQAFARTGDLNAVGALRYALAQRHGDRTSVLFIWTEGAVPLLQMFPKTGDAPGLDPKAVPRPDDSARLLSGAEHGAPYSFTAYRTHAASPEALLAWYRNRLPASGFVVSDGPSGALWARQGERTLLIRAARARAGVVSAVAEMK
jgi:hypothetical protein